MPLAKRSGAAHGCAPDQIGRAIVIGAAIDTGLAGVGVGDRRVRNTGIPGYEQHRGGGGDAGHGRGCSGRDGHGDRHASSDAAGDIDTGGHGWIDPESRADCDGSADTDRHTQSHAERDTAASAHGHSGVRSLAQPIAECDTPADADDSSDAHGRSDSDASAERDSAANPNRRTDANAD